MRRALLVGQALQPRGLDVDRGPVLVELAGEARGAAHHVLRARLGPDAAEHAPVRLPGGLDRLVGAVARTSSSTTSATRRSAISRSASRLPLRKNLRPSGPARRGRPGPRPSFRRASSSSADMSTITVSSARVEERVGHRLGLGDAGDLGHHVVQALQVLHAHRREDVDAVRRAPRRRRSSASDGARPAGWSARGRRSAARRGGARARASRSSSPGRGGSTSKPAASAASSSCAVHVEHADHHVAPGLLHAARRGEHRVGLAGAGKGAEEDLELAAAAWLQTSAILAGLECVAMEDALLLARAQFGLNIGFHILFPTLTIALAWFLLGFRIRLPAHPRSGLARDLQAVGQDLRAHASPWAWCRGVVMSFQFGTNWPRLHDHGRRHRRARCSPTRC